MCRIKYRYTWESVKAGRDRTLGCQFRCPCVWLGTRTQRTLLPEMFDITVETAKNNKRN